MRASTELAELGKLDLKGDIKLKYGYGEKMSDREIRSKINGLNRNIADELILNLCKSNNSLLITKDEWLSKRASIHKINSLLIQSS